jgi:hypothetical protein
LVLGEQEPPVDDHVELTDAAGFELGLDAGRLLDFRRETRGAGPVVSGPAKQDRDGHRNSLD